MREHGHTPTAPRLEAAQEPVGLLGLLDASGTAEQAVDADEAPAAAVLAPAIRADEAAPARASRRVDGLRRPGKVTDVVVAGQNQHRHGQASQPLDRVGEVFEVIGAVARHISAYVYGAICLERGVGAGLVMPKANAEGLNDHLAEIEKAVMPGAHAVSITDGAGWHNSKDSTVPGDISLLRLPAHAPDLNRRERLAVPTPQQARASAA